MPHRRTGGSVAAMVLAMLGCARSYETGAPALANAEPSPPPLAHEAASESAPSEATRAGDVGGSDSASVGGTPLQCSAADWTPRELAPLLQPGKTSSPAQPDRAASEDLRFAPECTDSPEGRAGDASSTRVVVDGVELRVASVTAAGSSGRGWQGNQCEIELRLADGSGRAVRLGADVIPPFNMISALVRSGSAVWLTVSFNGYTAEFPKGGNRIIAVDLCDGRVVWRSKDGMSNGGLLLLEDYLISAFGFTRERRYVYVLDARSGAIVQQLPVIENICPSKSWAPNWRAGERCDAPRQAVGAATSPRVEGGVFLVDTNTGSSAFEFR